MKRALLYMTVAVPVTYDETLHTEQQALDAAQKVIEAAIARAIEGRSIDVDGKHTDYSGPKAISALPPVDNDHVAPGCELFSEADIASARAHGNAKALRALLNSGKALRHASSWPGLALCGVDEPNQSTTTSEARVTCPDCRRALGIPKADQPKEVE